MKLIPCPLNGWRNADEFVCGGELTALPAPDASDEAWVGYIFNRSNPAGLVREWWYHVPTSYWFILERDTLTDAILRSCTVEQYLKESAAPQ
jgi:sarcosine oxidase subunit delta